MGRFRLGAVAVFTLAALVGRAGAAEMTRVASRGEPGNAFDLHVSLRWDRSQERAQITREAPDGSGGVVLADELRYTRTVNAVVPRVAVAIAEDLEIHFEWPYVLGDDREWRFGIVGAAPAGGVPGHESTIENNTVDANGLPLSCFDTNGDGAPNTCALFPVAPRTTIYHGGRGGDLKAGLAWGIFNDRKDPTKPFWLVGLDVTFPTAARYDPGAGRGTDWSSPNNVPGHAGPFGEKVWKWDLYTALSRRLGPIDPYVKAHATIMTESSSTYSNCEHAAEFVAAGQMNGAAYDNCADPAWADETGARLPWLAGITLGTELVPWEDAAAQQRVALDVRLFGDYRSSQRFYNELTDASGRLHETSDYFTIGGFVGFYVRASRYVSLHATASLATQTAHWLSGESLGRGGAWPAVDPATGLAVDPSQTNPNFDWRYDAPGRRFRISEVALFDLSFGGTLRF